jgi:hypothetical protein
MSDKNPQGNITNWDLQLAASLVTKDVTAQLFDIIRERTLANGSDNLPTVYWQKSGSTTTTSAPAYLLRAQLLEHYHRYNASNFLPGPVNIIADDASCLLSLSPHQLVSHSNRQYPQSTLWVFAPLWLQLLSAVISAQRSKQPNGAPFVSTSVSIPDSLWWGGAIFLLQVFAHRYCTGAIAPSGRTM